METDKISNELDQNGIPPASGNGNVNVGKVIIDKTSVMRHCAMCLDSICPNEVKLCGKCHKRAYCNRQCQSRDWKPKGNGQGHKNWCGLEYGEEDIDWEVISTREKGQAVFAKRFFPKMSRIMVDGFGTQRDVFEDMKDSCDNLGRSVTINHCCDANSGKFPVHDVAAGLNVMVVYAINDIQKGEEITTNLICFNETNSCMPSITGLRTFEEGRRLLKIKWKVICPPDCFCWNEEVGKVIQESRIIDASILETGLSVIDANMDLDLVKQLLIKHEVIHGSILDLARILSIRFRAAIQQKATLKLAEESLKEVCLIYASILHPEYELVQRHEKWMKDITSHPDYRKFDKQGGSVEFKDNFVDMISSKRY